LRIFHGDIDDERHFIELAPDIVAVIVQTLFTGWTRARASFDVHPDAGEVLMTERLRDAMRHVLKTAGNRYLVVLPGTESRSRPDVIVPDGRTDIPLFHLEIFIRAHDHDPHAIIECKRVNGRDARLCREYVREGIDRFVGGKYAGRHAAGFMVGYVIEDMPEHAVNGINAVLKRAERVEESLAPCVSDNMTFWHSRHLRLHAVRPLDLHHVFLVLD